ncbi:Clavaminate synthase-like protein [Rhizodiscina lignyota]|uniref:Clavaminate synthase-like protein n=1 Tax=Rhizodiscina lignyota TaxID=1504668 RepID=A0A9P4M7Q9_9PEZI|nr:Clavaminate synthase-like protein [Rhizodiscina lignyota]
MAAAVASPQASSSVNLQGRDEYIQEAKNYLHSRVSKDTGLSSKKFEIPVIDLAPSFSPSLADRISVASKIRDACTSSGFFYITSHGISSSVCDSALKLADRFFKELPFEKKDSLHMRNSSLHRGWEPSEFTSLEGQSETKEGFNWGYEEAFDPTGGDGKYVELDGSATNGNMWPAEDDLPGFYGGIKEYYGQVLQLARHLFRLFALSLDLPETHFDAMTTHPGGIARILYYPAGAPQAGDTDMQDIGLGAHSDYECFTILLCSSAPGLEILSPNNEWISAAPVPGSFIVNVADFLMRWTNGVYKSTIHRVVNRTQDARYSIPFFFSINYDETVETLPTCVSEDNPSKYPPINAGRYILDRLNDVVVEGYGGTGASQ